MGEKATLEAALQDDNFPLWVLLSTAAGWKGDCLKLELFPDGRYRVLWSQMIGNLYESPGILLSIPVIDETFAGSDDNSVLAVALAGSDELAEIQQEMRSNLGDYLAR